MPNSLVKTPKDEELWAEAKKLAKEEGKAKDWAYITGIFKRMHGGKIKVKEAAASEKKARHDNYLKKYD